MFLCLPEELYILSAFIVTDVHSVMSCTTNKSVNWTHVHQLHHQVESSPFVERLLKKGYEVIFLTEPVDEYCIQSLPEFEGKKFQNVAKEGLKIDGEDSEAAKERKEELEAKFEPLLKWLKDAALGDEVGLHRKMEVASLSCITWLDIALKKKYIF